MNEIPTVNDDKPPKEFVATRETIALAKPDGVRDDLLQQFQEMVEDFDLMDKEVDPETENKAADILRLGVVIGAVAGYLLRSVIDMPPLYVVAAGVSLGVGISASLNVEAARRIEKVKDTMKSILQRKITQKNWNAMLPETRTATREAFKAANPVEEEDNT